MANPIPAGDYYILSASSSTWSDGYKAISVNRNNMTNGSNVYVEERVIINSKPYSSVAQIFNVSYRSDGSMQIASKLCAKTLDTPERTTIPEQGANIQIYTDEDSRMQKWDLVSTGSTIGYMGATYTVYNIKSFENGNYRVTYNESTLNVGLRDYTSSAESSRTKYYKWIFVPVPLLQSGGLYEIIPIQAKQMRVDVSWGSDANGANVQVYTKNGSNNQKFMLTDTGNGWRIRNIASGKYLDVAQGALANKTNVQSWEANNERQQIWKVVTYDDIFYADDGTTRCQVVRFGAANDLAYSMDVSSSGQYANATNVQIWETLDQDNQRFALLQTTAQDAHIPTPYDLGISESVGGDIKSSIYLPIPLNGGTASQVVFPSWYCVDGWANGGPNSFEWRMRSRFMDSLNQTWGTYGDYSKWTEALVTRARNRYTITNGFTASVDSSLYIAAEYEIQVRACIPNGYDATNLEKLHGEAADKVCTVYLKPSITLTNPELNGKGLVYSYTSNYHSVTKVLVDNIRNSDTGAPYLSIPYLLSQDDTATELVIPFSELTNIPKPGDSIDIFYRLGTDLYEPMNDLYSSTDQIVSLGEHTTIDATYEDGIAYTDTVLIPDNVTYATVYICVGNYTLECDQIPVDDVGKIGFMIPYPFGVPYEVVISAVSPDESIWYYRRDSFAARDVHVHAWNYHGHACVLECRDDEYLSTTSTINAQAEEQLLNGREWSYTQMADTSKGTFSAVGAVVDGTTESNYAVFDELAGKHAVYRSVSGDIFTVAVTSVQRETNLKYDVSLSTITVNMNRETV